MEKRTLGSLEVSLVGLGCNNFGRRLDEAGSRAVVETALDAGITFFDTADIYGDGRSEEYLGRALGERRAGVVVATKMGNDGRGASAERVAAAAEASLRRLGLERIDLYQLHVPDPATPVGETLEAFDRLIRDGVVGEIGCSNFSEAQLEEAQRVALERGLRPFR